MTSLYELSTEYQSAFNEMMALDMDEQTIADTLEGLQGELEVKGRSVAAYFLNLQADVDAIKEAEGRMVARRKSLESKVTAMKDYLRDNMQKTGITEISCPEFCIKIGKPSKAVEITNELLIPEEYKKVVTTERISKTDISKALKAGNDIPGAQLVDGKPRLTIK
jgi:hypothetical protein